MKKLSFIERMNIPESEFSRDEKLEKEINQLKKEFNEKTKKEFPDLDGRIWEAYETFRKGQVTGADNLVELDSDYKKFAHKKQGIKDTHRRATEEKNRERENLVKPYREEAITLMDLEYRKIIDRYILELPPFAQSPGGERLLDHRGMTKDPMSNTRYMIIRTNAGAIVHGQELLVSYKGRIVNAPSLKALKESLESLQKEFDVIDWTAREIEVEEDTFERIDTTKPNQLGYLVGNRVIKVKEVTA